VFTVVEPGRRHDATIRWTQSGTATTTAGPGMRTVRRLDGTAITIEPGDPVAVGEEPILLESVS